MAYDPKWIRDDAVVKRNGTNDLTGDWDIGNERSIILDELQIRDTSGLSVTDTTGNVVAHINDTNGQLTLLSGIGVNEFSTDNTLALNSDNVVPTQSAIKTYVDTSIVGLTPDTLYYNGDPVATTQVYGLTIVGDTYSQINFFYNDSTNLGLAISSYTDDNAYFDLWAVEGAGFIFRGEGYGLVAKFIDGAACELYYDGVKAFETNADGIRVQDTNDNHPSIIFVGADDGQNGYIQFHDSGELTIYNSDDSQAILVNSAAGQASLYNAGIKVLSTNASGGLITRSPDGTKAGELFTGDIGTTTLRSGNSGALQLYENNNIAIYCNVSASVDLYYAGTKTLITKWEGASITATAPYTELSLIGSGDSNEVAKIIETGGIMQISSYAATPTPAVIVLGCDNAAGSLETVAKFTGGSAAELYYNNVKRFNTTTDGDGGTLLTSDVGDLFYQYFGTSDIYYQTVGTSSRHYFIGANSADVSKNLMILNPDGAADLYHTGILAFATQINGVAVYDTSGDDPILEFKNDAAASVGYIQILNNDMVLSTSGETHITCNADASVDLYYDGAKVAETSVQGLQTSVVTVGTGQITYPTTPSGSFILEFRGTQAVRYVMNDGVGNFQRYFNAYYDSGATEHKFILGATGATRMAVTGGATTHYVSNTSAGSAGDNITWLTAMTIAADTAVVSFAQAVNVLGNLRVSGTVKEAGHFYAGTTAPTNTTRLNYDGYLYGTKVYGAVWG